MTPPPVSSTPAVAALIKTLRDGYWARTELIQLPDGSQRVRKTARPGAEASPWGIESLRREIRYLMSLPQHVARHYPQLLAAWGHDGPGVELGYEMAYIENTCEAAELARAGAMSQVQADQFQDQLAKMIFHDVHQPATADESLAGHVDQVIADSLSALHEQHPQMQPLIDAADVQINGQPLLGTRAAMQQLVDHRNVLDRLDQPPCVRLHGDLILENVLLPCDVAAASSPGTLTLIDPVSVAAIAQGHPLFDLVKYESYATGELPALRSETIDITGFEQPQDMSYTYHVREQDPAIAPFKRIDFHRRFRSAYVDKYSPVDAPAYHLLDAYFALAMAINTFGLQRHARLLKATLALNSAASTT